jgi:hypothetical protein
MNIDDLRVAPTQSRRVDPMAYATRRLSSLLVVAAATLGIVSAVLAEAAGASDEVALGVGLVMFLTGAAVGDTLASRVRRPSASISEPNGDSNRRIKTHEPSSPRRPRDWASSMHLGPDPEQVIGRKTGART